MTAAAFARRSAVRRTRAAVLRRKSRRPKPAAVGSGREEVIPLNGFGVLAGITAERLKRYLHTGRLAGQRMHASQHWIVLVSAHDERIFADALPITGLVQNGPRVAVSVNLLDGTLRPTHLGAFEAPIRLNP